MGWYVKVLKDYAVFTGRARRQEFWMFTLFNILIAIALMIIDGVGGFMIGDSGIGVLYLIYVLAVIIPCIAVNVRRLHDTNRSGWWYLRVLIPFLGALILLIFMCLDSTPGDNQYGPNPKESAA